jgi:hypothetical protein
MVLELHFGHKIQVGIEYVFPGCGDEHINLGKRDLRLHIQSVSFSSASMQVRYSSKAC